MVKKWQKLIRVSKDKKGEFWWCQFKRIVSAEEADRLYFFANFTKLLTSLQLQSLREEVIKVSPLKKGQKLTDNPKNVNLSLRLTKAEAKDLQYCDDKLGTSRTK